MKKEQKRCGWVDLQNPLYIKYHDKEWGIPVHNDKKLFEMLILEGAQAGLSWSTVLKKRRNYQKAFDNFDFKKIAYYSTEKQQELLKNEGIIRNRLKISATIENAKSFIKIHKEFGTFDKYLWNFVDNKPIQNNFRQLKDLPSQTKLSKEISKDLKKRGMNFVGPTIIYAFMQAIGVVNDHQTNCFRHKEVQKKSQKQKAD